MAKIMIVEDSPTQMEALKKIAEQMGHTTICLLNADRALDEAISVQPDLILMDLVMPGTNGFQATRMLANNGRTSHIPIVVVTTKKEPTDEVWARRQGAKDYLTKPFAEKDLMALINKHLS